jgi:Domain of unknown function (DUF4412)
MKTWRVCTTIVTMAFLAVSTSFAQRMMGAGPRDIGSANMAKIFGNNQAFSATASITIADAGHGTSMGMETSYAFLNGNVRTEMDMASMKGAKTGAKDIAQMKQMGMDRMINIYRGDKKLTYLLYPGLQSYCEMALPKAPAVDKPAQQATKVDVTELGKETVDGHPCVKNKVTFTADDGSQHEMTVWNATDLKDFPIKTEMHEGGSTIATQFHDVKLSAPSASLFDPPSDYKQYGNMQEMMMGNMQRFMPPGAGHSGGNE